MIDYFENKRLRIWAFDQLQNIVEKFDVFNIAMRLWKKPKIRKENPYAQSYDDLIYLAIPIFLNKKKEKESNKEINKKYYSNKKKKYGIKDKVIYTPEERKQAKKLCNKRYYEKNRDKIIKHNTEYNKINKERVNERRRKK